MSASSPHAGHDDGDMMVPDAGAGTGLTSVDPVCGMTVTLKPDSRSESFGGSAFHFCSEKCQTKFKGDP